MLIELMAVGFCYWAAYQTTTVRAVPRPHRIVQAALLGTVAAVAVLLFLAFIGPQ
jgi:hypothetical protein